MVIVSLQSRVVFGLECLCRCWESQRNQPNFKTDFSITTEQFQNLLGSPFWRVDSMQLTWSISKSAEITQLSRSYRSSYQSDRSDNSRQSTIFHGSSYPQSAIIHEPFLICPFPEYPYHVCNPQDLDTCAPRGRILVAKHLLSSSSKWPAEIWLQLCSPLLQTF